MNQTGSVKLLSALTQTTVPSNRMNVNATCDCLSVNCQGGRRRDSNQVSRVWRSFYFQTLISMSLLCCQTEWNRTNTSYVTSTSFNGITDFCTCQNERLCLKTSSYILLGLKKLQLPSTWGRYCTLGCKNGVVVERCFEGLILHSSYEDINIPDLVF